MGLELKYFVLKPNGTSEHAKASRAALRAYARTIHRTNPDLARDLTGWADFADEEVAIVTAARRGESGSGGYDNG